MASAAIAYVRLEGVFCICFISQQIKCIVEAVWFEIDIYLIELGPNLKGTMPFSAANFNLWIDVLQSPWNIICMMC